MPKSQPGELHGRSKLTNREAELLRVRCCELIALGTMSKEAAYRQAAAQFEVSHETAKAIHTGRRR